MLSPKDWNTRQIYLALFLVVAVFLTLLHLGYALFGSPPNALLSFFVPTILVLGLTTLVVFLFNRQTTQHRALLTAMENAQQAKVLQTRENQQILERMLNGFALHEIIYDASGAPVDFRFLSVNPAFEQLSGFDAGSVVGKTLREVLPESESPLLTAYMHVGSSGEPTQLEVFSTVRGRYFQVNAFFPEPGKLAVLFNDVTARRETEDAEREEKERFRQVFDHGPVGIALTALDGKFIDVNPTLCKMLGYQAQELCNHSFVEFTHPEDIEPNLTVWQKFKRGEISDYRLDKRYLRKNGSVLWVHLVSTGIRDRDGKILYQLSMMQDISQEKQFIQELRQNEERFRTVSDIMSDYAYSLQISALGRMTRDWSSGPLTRMTGYSESEIDTRGGWQSLVHSDDITLVQESMHRVLGGSRDTTEYRILTRTGEIRWVREYVSPQWDDKQQRVVRLYGAIQDITERKRVEQAEREQRQLAEALRDTAAVLNSSINLEQLIERALDNVERIVPHQAANIMLIEGNFAHVVGTHGYGNAQTHSTIADRRIDLRLVPSFRQLLAKGRPGLIRDTRDYPEWVTFPETSWIRSYVYAPIRLRNSIIGVLNLDSAIPNFFNDNALARVQTFTDQLAIALENARLLQAIQHHATQFEVLYEAGIALNRVLEPRAQIESLLTNALRAVEKNRADFYFVDDVAQTVTFFVGKGYAPEIQAQARKALIFTFADLEQPAVRAVRTQQIVQIADVAGIPHWIDLDPGIRSGIWIPIRQQSTMLGVFAVFANHPDAFTRTDEQLLELLANQAAISLENARLFEETSRRATQLEALHRAAARIQQSLEPMEIYRVACEELNPLGTFAQVYLRTAEGFRHLHTSMSDRMLEDFLEHFGQGPFEPVVPETILQDSIRELERGETLLQRQFPLTELGKFIPGTLPLVEWMVKHSEHGDVLVSPLMREGKLFGILAVIGTTVRASDLVAVSLFARQVSAALENARLFAETRRRLQELDALNRISIVLRQVNTPREMADHVLHAVLEIFETSAGELLLFNPDHRTLRVVAADGWLNEINAEIPHGEGIVGHVFTTDTTYLSPDLQSDPRLHQQVDPAKAAGWGGAFVPLRSPQETIGVLAVAYPGERGWSASAMGLLETIAAMAGNAFVRAALYEQTERRVRQLAALRAIDAAITASTDLQLTLEVLLTQTLAQLEMDAGDVLTFRPTLQTLEYAAGRGFHTTALQYTRLRLGQGHAGTAALERKLLVIPDLKLELNGLAQSTFLHDENFVSYVAVPLVAQGSLRGVLELFKRTFVQPDAEWLEFVQAIGAQAAISIDNAELFRTLQTKNLELALAYDSTIEGWSRALDLRDKETEGHTQRVTEMTLKLARTMGIADETLMQMRRGSLLHDIGKMGIPDTILLKPDKLTDQEWIIMRKHPQLAYELLSPIQYLRPALDIPHYHHERWDGSGYPHGLKGQAIPLAARIFAIVDCWDALRSDRPYREGWSDERVRAYLESESGKSFEPAIVKIFLRMISGDV